MTDAQREKRYAYTREWRIKNAQRVKDYSRDYYRENREELLRSPEKKSYAKEWREKNSDRLKSYFHDRYESNKEEHLAKCRANYQKNRDRILAQCKEYASRNKERISERARLYRKSRSAEFIAKAKAYAQKYPERVKAYKKKWQDAHKHENLMKCKERRARLRQAKVDSRAASQFYRWIHNQDYVTCTYCGVFITGRSVHIDHIVPITKGGSHEPDNFCVSCQSCNASKGDLMLHEWPRCPDKFKTN